MSSTGLERQFVWTVLPAGRVVPVPGHPGPMALLSVLLTPRLLGPAGSALTVADFGMQAWPRRLAEVGFDVRRAGQSLPTTRVPYTALDGSTVQFPYDRQLAAWQALFTAAMPVEPYAAAFYDGRDTRAFPAGQAGADVRGIYTVTAQTHAAHRGAAPESHPGLRAALRAIEQQWQPGLLTSGTTPPGTSAAGTSPVGAAPPGAAPTGATPALAQAYAFYRREGRGTTPLGHPAAAPEAEFHRTVTHLADHPVLLRALGLLVDLAVPASGLAPVDQAHPAELCVVPQWPRQDPDTVVQTDLSPTTAYTLTGTRFLPSAVDGPTSTGFANGLLPLTGTGLAPSANPRFELMSFDVDGAALRLVSTARSDASAPPPEGASPVPVGALPALHSTGFALVDRAREDEHRKQLQRAQQRATPAGLLASALLADSLLGGYRMDVFDEKHRTWHSLCRRRVHYTVGGVPLLDGLLSDGLLEEGYLRPGPVVTGSGDADALYLHEIVARWDGWSLVAQRPERITDTGDTLPVPLGPALETVVECDVGSLPRLRFGRRYQLRVRIADLAGGGLFAEEVDAAEARSDSVPYWRFEPLPPPELVPTREWDDGDGHDRMVIRSDRGTSAADYAALHGYRAYDLRHLLPPKASLALAMQYDGAFDTALGPSAPDQEVDRLFAVARRADRELTDVQGATTVPAGPNAPSSYVVVPETDLVLPWLADPSGVCVAMNARPRPIGPNGRPGPIVPPDRSVIAIWQGTWPDLQSASVRLEAATSGCTVSRPDPRHVSVALGPAEQVTFDIPSCPRFDDVALFGIAMWQGVDPTVPHRRDFQDVVAGRNRLLTPPRTVTMVHAVQRPLADPSGQLTPLRGPGDRDTVLGTDGLSIDVPSTGRIDLHAEWTDRVDTPPAAPTTTTRRAHVGSYEVQHLPPKEALPVIRQEFGDTRHHRVGYAVTAVSRFEDCFARVLAADPHACLASGTLSEADVPSTVRPPAPKPRHCVPSFGWTRTTDGQRSLTRLRRGGGLRVLLERPWYVSGNDEALAVLTLPPGPVPAEALRYVAVAGRDPIRDTGAPPAVLTGAQVNAAQRAQVTLPELQRQLDAALYQVEFDAEGNGWFVDLDLAPVVAASYFPFVRLALARYQPYTLPGVPDVSHVVLTEAVQLAPQRQLTVSRGAGQASVVLEGLGPGGTGNTVRTELQVQDAGVVAPDAVTGWSTVLTTSTVLGQTGVISLPDTGQRAQRLVVQEFETQPLPTGTGATGRPVFVDVVALGTW
ncbi:hypothetical protein [Kitasatospora aureofaciens]|uniref:hypothetical protein n=1 Tax=Kitasatospora aureofaciens TaxID=1894 RepID=UPI0005268D0A|nr:hypothetical protein [Kitasatospora aureofaciens]